ncbi:MAG: aldolase/citrate lyase family protein [Clostridiales bacterium]|nr:aldolase/citrate lyase family protein [Clostridiales bacterium]MDD6937229.1 aldolase/citrate lyase family protein [Clostridiales bacterium]MDY2960973.1 aldolase/citrate lyase family protein [Oscillospiraceae bacterium]
MKNMVREKLLAGEPTLGTFFETGSATVAECLGLAGLDYIIIDTEHGPFNPQSALEFVRAAKLYGLTPFARVQEISRAAILKLLDVGVMGLVIPDVRTVAEVEKIVEYGKYLPLGKRGVANTAGSGFWFEDYAQHGLEHYFEVSNRETMLLPQCETVECLEHLEEIVGVPGIDGIYVGPFDLSTALGKPAQFDDPEIKDVIAHIQGVCRAAGKFSFIYAADEATARADFALGYDSVTMGMDATVLTNAFKGVRKTILG